jgi:glycosyltransferase involved in cell wall biosynthesis
MIQKQICIVPKLDGLGGPASFQRRLIPVLQENGCTVHHDLNADHIDVILVNGGTRNLGGLIRARQKGIPIVQRLAQMNWVHLQKFSGLRYTYRSERNNLLLSFIRRYLASDIIYQSNFVQQMWQDHYGKVSAMGHIIYNGVDTEQFIPSADFSIEVSPIRILVVEGHLGEGNEVYLANAIHFGEAITETKNTPVIMSIAGDVPKALQEKWHRSTGLFTTEWLGVIDQDALIARHNQSHFMFSAELNGGCPNSVIEAMSCGNPVIGYATGALTELLMGGAGIAVPYGGNHWKLEPADVGGLVKGANLILSTLTVYRLAARKKAVQHYDIRTVSQRYLDILLKANN